ncbi:MAG: hypothetical protein IKB34_00880 [Clostridia bacterium]|nr:hypothetical protein [Clostridia bacterium]
MIAKIKFENEAEKEAYVRLCDKEFENRLDEIMKAVCSVNGLRYLTLSGPTCSGKTTASKKLISEFCERGKKVKIISLDDFFRNRSTLEAEARAEGRKVDFDSEKALDLDALGSFVASLKEGRASRLPKFDFKLGKRIEGELFSPEDTDIIIFEGIQAIYPAFTSMISGIPCLSLIINVEDPLTVGDTVFSPRTVRLMRRLVRDYRFRGASPEFSFLLWESVTENEDKNILPFVGNADLRLNSLLGYEACMMKPYLCPLMESVPKDSPYRKRAEMFLEAMRDIDMISSDYLPENALYREFI